MAKYTSDGKSLEYENYSEFLQIQGGRAKRFKPFDVSECPHIVDDILRFKRFLFSIDARILDAGCRDGWAMGYLKHLGYPCVVGIDVIRENIDVAREHGYEVVEEDLHLMKSFDSDSFDAVFCRHTLEHCIDPRVVVGELWRVLKPGGVFFCVVPLESRKNPPDVKYGHSTIFESFSELKSICVGFEQIFSVESEKSKSGKACIFVGEKIKPVI